MTLQDWLENRWLHHHQPTKGETARLLKLVDRDIADASLEGLSPDWRIGIAYNAMLQLALLALAAEGYRPERSRAHELAIHSLQFTIELEAIRVRYLDAIRKARNASNYDEAGNSTREEANEATAAATALRARVMDWLMATHPHLVPP